MTDLGNARDAGSSFSRLESLSISGFRGIDQLTIPRLGRVALIAGKNGIGKTTVLDAVRIYAARGRFDALRELLTHREEFAPGRNEEGDRVDVPNFDSLFNRTNARHAIEIGPSCGPALQVQYGEEVPFDDEAINLTIDTDSAALLVVSFGDTRVSYAVPELALAGSRRHHVPRDQEKLPAPIRLESLGPATLPNKHLARLWDEVALTDGEELVVEALRLVYGERVKRAAVIGDDFRNVGRRVVVKLSDHSNPVPLKSLGDGVTRMFGVALAMADCQDGILLLDEAENGVHYSLQSKFWSMVLQAAETHNIQVLATTHSKDCINGFAAAALAHPEVEGNLVRIGWRNDKLRAVDYSKEQLEVAAAQNIEVR